jgi:hypothetical protein
VDDDEGRTESNRARHRHGRTDAKHAGLVAGCRDHPAFGRIAANHDRLAAQRGIITLLDGRIEGVHVDMQDAALARRLICHLAFAISIVQFPISICHSRFQRLAAGSHASRRGTTQSPR